jgi:hypothetical protein
VGIAQKPNALRAQLSIDVRVVDDFAGQKNSAVGEPAPRLIGVVDGPVDPVTETKFTGEQNREPSALVPEVIGLDLLNESAVVAVGEDSGHLVFEVEPFAKDDWRH